LISKTISDACGSVHANAEVDLFLNRNQLQMKEGAGASSVSLFAAIITNIFSQSGWYVGALSNDEVFDTNPSQRGS